MLRKVLIVDDNPVIIQLLKRTLIKYKDTFSLVTASDGLAAIDVMKEQSISLVVTDLQMPRMDGFGLLAHLSANYPDIPVLIITAHDKPKIKQAALARGATDFTAKPFEADDMAKKILLVLNKELEGGTLNNVSLETFIQLVEMEQKTCTIRVHDKITTKRGVLFFRNGELLNARINDLQGNRAAYEIFSWDKITLSIENDCAQKKKNIEGDLQGILLEAMRLKDEAADENSNVNNENIKQSNDYVEDQFTESSENELNEPDVHKSEPAQVSLVDQVRMKIEKSLGNKNGLEDIYIDNDHNELIFQSLEIGKFFEAGSLKVMFFDQGANNDFILIPKDENILLTVNHQCPRDRIIHLLSEL